MRGERVRVRMVESVVLGVVSKFDIVMYAIHSGT